MEKRIREPKQERATETKNKIIEASYKLFSSVGYYSTTTPEIAKSAGVSTGIVYSYFKDKHDILLCVLKIYINKITAPIMELFKGMDSPVNLEEFVPKVIDVAIKMHKENANLHNTLHSLASSDTEVNAEFISLEDEITKDLNENLLSLGIKVENMKEKIHLSMNTVQSFSHEYIYDKHAYLDYEKMKKTVCDLIVNLFRN